MITDELKRLYLAYTGHEPEAIRAFPPSGSNRHYFRLTGTPTLIGVNGESPDENRAFFYMSGHFHRKGLPVPQVVARSHDGLCYLQEDLGDLSLFAAIEQGRTTGTFSETEKQLLKKAVRLLPDIQVKGAEEMDFSQCYPPVGFTRESIQWDLNYFKYCFLKPSGISFQEDLLEKDFQSLTDTLLHSPCDAFMYRDFQSRNILIKEGEPWLIDFQGGRKGPIYYDIASFLWQAKANFPMSLRKELFDEYYESMCRYRTIDKKSFYDQYLYFVLFRLMQVLGAYGFRGYFERKPHFIQSVPYAIANLQTLMAEQPFHAFPHLNQVLQRLIEKESPTKKTKEKESTAATCNTEQTPERVPAALTVSVCSFSYKKGIPADPSGNGGGFVFDCRAVHNPGRYDRYKQLTGLDEPVIRFLEEDGEITGFLEHVYALVDASVKRYMERGFTHLTVCFGCTGGQHRSVYSAQHLAEHLHRQFGVSIHLVHREQGIEQDW